jgi:hypothetical protein
MKAGSIRSARTPMHGPAEPFRRPQELFFRRMQRPHGLGAYYCQQITDVDVAIQFRCLNARQRTASRRLAQFIHPRYIALGARVCESPNFARKAQGSMP